MAATTKPKATQEQITEAQALWEIALRYIAITSAASALAPNANPTAIMQTAYVAGALIARAYYRLTRAIFTGYTLEGGEVKRGTKTSLADLHADFAGAAYSVIPKSKQADVRKRVALAGKDYEQAMADLFPREDDESLAEYAEASGLKSNQSALNNEDYKPEKSDWSEERNILVERLKEFDEWEKRRAQELADEAKALRENLADLERKSRLADKRRQKYLNSAKASAKYAARRKAQAKTKVRGKRAAIVMQSAQQGARAQMTLLTQNDKRAIGYVRQPHSVNPCAWCLALASRGIMLYKSEASARAAWHPNCQCSAEPVFSRDEYFTSDRFLVNRSLNRLWYDHAGAGKENWSNWRKFWANQTGAGLSPEERILNKKGFRTLNEVVRANAQKHITQSQEDKAA